MDAKTNYSYSGYSGNTVWSDVNTSSLLGGHALRCILVDAKGNTARMDGGSFTVNAPSSTTSTTTVPTSTTLNMVGEMENTFSFIADEETCPLAGDDPPCGQVTLREVVANINRWAANDCRLGDVVALVNAWSAP